MSRKVDLYKARDGDYDFFRNKDYGYGLCRRGLQAYSGIPEYDHPEVLTAVFTKREPKGTDHYAIVILTSIGRSGQVRRKHSLDLVGKPMLFEDFRAMLRKAHDAGYRYMYLEQDA